MQKDDQKYIVSGFFGAIANGLVFPVMAVTFAGMLFMMLSRSGDYMRKRSYYLAAMFGLIAGLLCIPSAALQFYGFGKAGERPRPRSASWSSRRCCAPSSASSTFRRTAPAK